MKKNLLVIIWAILLLPTWLFAGPADSIVIDINTITCPNGAELNICWWINADLHNKFVSAMKKKDSVNAIKYWNKMLQSTDGSDITYITPVNVLFEPLFGTYAPEWTRVLPNRILAKKAYKWGIITLGTNNIQDWVLNEYYVSYIKYKNSGMVYVYNEPLVPLNSKQYNTYSKIYLYSNFTEFNQFDKDIKTAFNKWKFNNKYTNAVYQKFIKSIR